MIEYIIGERGSGKTTELIKRSAETGAYILAPNKTMASFIMRQAIDMGYANIPYPVTVSEISRNAGLLSKAVRERGLYIDELEMILRQILNGIDIKAVTVNRQPDQKITQLSNHMNKWNSCRYVDGKLLHDGTWEDGKWYEWLDKYGHEDIARMKHDVVDHFFPSDGAIKEEDVVGFREIAKGENI